MTIKPEASFPDPWDQYMRLPAGPKLLLQDSVEERTLRLHRDKQDLASGLP